MKSSKLKIILISLFSLVAIAFAGALFVVKDKVSPEEIRKITLEQLQKAFPKAKVELGHVELGLGLNVSVKIKSLNLDLPYRGRNYKLASVNDLNVKVPLWSILTGGGSLDINIKAPEVNYKEFKKTTNWDIAGGGKKATPTKKNKVKSSTSGDLEEDTSTEIPSFVENSSVNIKIMDMQVSYALRDRSNGKVKISKFLIKKLNLKSSSAFEVATNVNVESKPGEKISMDALLIGEFNLKEYLDNNSLSSVLNLTLENLKLPNRGNAIPTISTEMDLKLAGNGDLKLDFKTSIESRNKISGLVNIGSKVKRIENLSVEMFLKDVLKIAEYNDPMISPNEAKFVLNGNVNLDSKSNIYPNLTFSLAPAIGIKQGDIAIDSIMSGTFKKNRYKVATDNSILGGKIATNLTGRYDVNKKFDLKKMDPFKLDINIRQFSASRKVIQSALYPPKKDQDKNENANNASGGKKGPVEQDPPFIPRGIVNFSWDQLKVDNQDFSGSGKILTSGQTVSIKNMKLKYSKGSGSLSNVTKLGRKGMSHKFDTKLNNLNLDAFKAFLPPKMLKSIAGVFNGSVKGKAATFNDGRVTYDVVTSVKAEDGEIEGVNIQQFVGDIGNKYPKIKDGLKKLPKDGQFKKFVMNAHLRHDHYNLKNFEFLSQNGSSNLKGKGNIYPTSQTKKGTVFSDFIDKKFVSGVMKKQVGSDVIPLKLRGIGFSLYPDVGYTVGKLAKKAIKSRKKKVVNKAKKKLEEKLKNNSKVQELLKGKGKKLFKGLFK